MFCGRWVQISKPRQNCSVELFRTVKHRRVNLGRTSLEAGADIGKVKVRKRSKWRRSDGKQMEGKTIRKTQNLKSTEMVAQGEAELTPCVSVLQYRASDMDKMCGAAYTHTIDAS